MERQSSPTDAEERLPAEDLSSEEPAKSTETSRDLYPLMNLEDGIVGWDSQDDPANPRNFPPHRKWLILGLVSGFTFLSQLSSSILAPAMSFINDEFSNASPLLATFTVSVFNLGLCVGALIVSPLSEILGRRIVLDSANIVFSAFTLGCALAPNLGGLITMRFIASLGGSACVTIGAGIISDLFVPQERGKAMGYYASGVLFGPVLGPLFGGFISQRAGWRWDAWVPFIAGTTLTVAICIFNSETNPSVLLERKAMRLREELDLPDLESAMSDAKSNAKTKRRTIIKQGIVRPLTLLFTSPIILALSLYMSFIFGLMFLLFTTITQTYVSTYNWSPEITGLAYLGIGLGFFVGNIVVAKTSDATIVRLTKKNNGIFEPEMRLSSCVIFGCFVPVSMFWYGWATDQQAHWIVSIIGLCPLGVGIIGIFSLIQTYVIDSFPQYAASAIAGLAFLRYLFGVLLPLAGRSMYGSLGLGWGNSLLGFISIAMIPVPVLIVKYGGAMRKKHPI